LREKKYLWILSYYLGVLSSPFDSGVSHDFISTICAKRSKLALTVAKPSYKIWTIVFLSLSITLIVILPLIFQFYDFTPEILK
jgi:hypothetical protein